MSKPKAKIPESNLVQAVVREPLGKAFERGVWHEHERHITSGSSPPGKASANRASSLCTPLMSPNMYSYRAQVSHNDRPFSAGILAADRSNSARASVRQRTPTVNAWDTHSYRR